MESKLRVMNAQCDKQFHVVLMSPRSAAIEIEKTTDFESGKKHDLTRRLARLCE